MRGYTISIYTTHLGNFAAISRLTWPQGVAREPRSYGLCPTRGAAAPQGLRLGRAALRRTVSRAGTIVHGSTLVHDLRPTHDPRQSARDGQLPAGAGFPALSLRPARRRGQEHTGRRQRAAQLSHLSGCGAGHDRRGPPRIAGGPRPGGFRGRCLRPGLDDYRPVLEVVSLGGVSPSEGRRQGPRPVRHRRWNPCIHAGIAWQDARFVDARPNRCAPRSVLRDGSRLCGFRPPVSPAYRRGVPPDGPVLSDRLVRLRGTLSRTFYPDTLRLVRYVDPVTGRRLVFLTNNLTLDPLTIALLYRKRWQIELFFKWIKQHLHIKAFFGTTPNAVQTQLWIAVLVYVLVAQCKPRHQLPQTLNEILQILSVTILQKTPINGDCSTVTGNI